MKNDEKRHDIEYFMDGIFISPYDMRIGEYIFNVLMKLPDDALNFFLEMNSLLQIIQPVANSFYNLELSHYPDKAKITFILLVSDLCNGPKEEIIYTIAHEFAHVYLKHPNMKEDVNTIEIEADKQVIAWGFENELKACNSYIYGKIKSKKERR